MSLTAKCSECLTATSFIWQNDVISIWHEKLNSICSLVSEGFRMIKKWNPSSENTQYPQHDIVHLAKPFSETIYRPHKLNWSKLAELLEGFIALSILRYRYVCFYFNQIIRFVILRYTCTGPLKSIFVLLLWIRTSMQSHPFVISSIYDGSALLHL